MATQQATVNTAQALATEIAKIQSDLIEKQKQLNLIQQKEIDSVVMKFIGEIEKGGFDKVLVKKMIIEKLTRKHKRK